MSNYSRSDLVKISDAMFGVSANLNSAYTMCCLYCERDAWMRDEEKNDPEMNESFLLVILNQLSEAKRKLDLFVAPESAHIQRFLDTAEEIRAFLDEQAL